MHNGEFNRRKTASNVKISQRSGEAGHRAAPRLCFTKSQLYRMLIVPEPVLRSTSTPPPFTFAWSSRGLMFP